MAGVKLSQLRLRSPFFKKKKNSNNNNGQGSIQKIDRAPSSAEFAAQNSAEFGSSGAGSDEPAKTLQKKFAKLGITNVGGAGGDADGDAGNGSDDGDNNGGGGDQNKKEGGSSGNGEKAVKAVNDGLNLLVDSRTSHFKHIMMALSDPHVDSIGVYGMGGVGKTTLVQKVTQQAKENKLFDVVVWVTVTETPDIMEIQGQIADVLGMKLQQESEPGRAAQLRERMKKDNRILVILDDVWARLDLVSIGIPLWDDEKGSITQKVDQEGENAHKRQCKILLTTRGRDILTNGIGTQTNFEVEPLCFDGDDDDNTGGGGDKNKKKSGGSGDGEGNGDGGDKAEGGGGRKEKGMNEDCTGQLGFSYRCTYHAVYENEYPVEQLNAVKMFCSENMINDCSIMPSLNLVHC